MVPRVLWTRLLLANMHVMKTYLLLNRFNG
jgi:hypothetical protein